MVQEAFLITKDILIVRRFCARQVEIYNWICTHSTNEYIEYYRSVVNALFSRFETILILASGGYVHSSNIITHDDK